MVLFLDSQKGLFPSQSVSPGFSILKCQSLMPALVRDEFRHSPHALLFEKVRECGLILAQLGAEISDFIVRIEAEQKSLSRVWVESFQKIGLLTSKLEILQ